MNDVPAHEDAYREGYKTGYQAGVVDGRGQGYSDAKYRAHAAVDAARCDEPARRAMRQAIVEAVGQQQ